MLWLIRVGEGRGRKLRGEGECLNTTVYCVVRNEG